MNPSDRVVLVTGGGHDIGRAICEIFARGGARVVIADRSADAAESVAKAIRKETAAEALPAEVDVRDAASVEAAVEQVIDRFDQIDVLVNNAGIYPNTPVVEMSEEEWDAVFDTNVKGMFLVARRMIERGADGRMVNISSGSAKSGRIGRSLLRLEGGGRYVYARARPRGGSARHRGQRHRAGIDRGARLVAER
jgi:3-oxoacyl-[acyl-carrier protein] reductase